MKSYAFQDLPPKRIKKLAAQFSDAEIKDSFREYGNDPLFLLDEPDGTASLMIWNAFNGPMALVDEDSVRAYAQIDYLRRHGCPSFHSIEEVHAHAEKHSWPRKDRNAN
jgi:hypothetical protein